MKVLLDSCVWGGAKSVIKAAGHDVTWSGDWPSDPGDEAISQLALIKSLPYDLVFAHRGTSGFHNENLFGCKKFALVAAIETLGTYHPPYWVRERRTQIIKYGSIIQKR